MVQLPEMSDSVLHVTLRAQGKKLQMDDLTGVDVPPDRAAQSVYTEVATAENFTNTTRETIAEVDVPAHVPVQRIRFATDARNFLRRVRVEAWPLSDPHDVETISGAISSTHRDGISDTQLVVPMTLGANLQGPAHMRVILENDGQPPVQLSSMTLEMREHKMCFDASGSNLAMVEDADVAPLNTLPALAETSWANAGVAALGAAVASAPFDEKHAVDAHPFGLNRQTAERVFIAFFLVLFALTLTITAYSRKKKKTRG